MMSYEFFPIQESLDFLIGVALGFSLAAPPGPANALIAHFSTNQSRLAGFTVGMGASSADALVLALVSLTGFGSVLVDVAGKNLLLAGGIVMLAIAVGISRGLKKNRSVRYEGVKSTVPYFAGFLTNISSPYTITWWATVGLTLATTLGFAILGFFAALMIWNISFPSLLAYGKKQMPQIQRYVSLFAVATLSAFGIWFVARYILS
jgi:threonine/homoserine/homoserine lactone efflux protein